MATSSVPKAPMAALSPVVKSLGDDFAWSALDAAPDGVVIADSTGEIVFVNDQGARLFGYDDADALIGRPVEDLLPEDARKVHRAHRTRYRAAPTLRPMGADLSLRARRLDGTEFPVEISLSPLTVGTDVFVMAGIRDITERLDTEEDLRRVLHTLDASDDGVFIVDAATLRYSYVNEGATRLVGYHQEELLEMTPLHLDPDITEAALRELVESLLDEETGSVMRAASLMHKDGSDVPVEVVMQSAPAGRDGTRWLVALARDVSARLEAEEELRRSQDALREAEQVLAIADDRERIARDLHDTVIQRLFAAGLNLQATLARVDDATRSRLETTIDDLDATIRELRMAIFSLQASASTPAGLRGRLLEILTEAQGPLGCEPRLQLDGAIETISDEVAEHLLPTLREALSNIARHANATKVRVSLFVGDEVVLTVVDDGDGVPDEVLGGRGLANMQRRAANLGGSFQIERQDAGGSCLTWHVPAEVAAASRPESASSN